MTDFAAIDFETANGRRSSVCSVGIVIVRNGEIVDRFYSLIQPAPNFFSGNSFRLIIICVSDVSFPISFPIRRSLSPGLRGLHRFVCRLASL